MRLKSLYIRDYKILQDFSIDFTSNLSVLIGENGSGKSSIIECLAYIFGHLHKYFVLDDKTAEFIDGYKINRERDLRGRGDEWLQLIADALLPQLRPQARPRGRVSGAGPPALALRQPHADL